MSKYELKTEQITLNDGEVFVDGKRVSTVKEVLVAHHAKPPQTIICN